jgi:hypothetical protein
MLRSRAARHSGTHGKRGLLLPEPGCSGPLSAATTGMPQAARTSTRFRPDGGSSEVVTPLFWHAFCRSFCRH